MGRATARRARILSEEEVIEMKASKTLLAIFAFG
jgi:hypothetical protein